MTGGLLYLTWITTLVSASSLTSNELPQAGFLDINDGLHNSRLRHLVAMDSTSSGSGTAPAWGQCGGMGFTGPTKCASGTVCVKVSELYSQCQKITATTPPASIIVPTTTTPSPPPTTTTPPPEPTPTTSASSPSSSTPTSSPPESHSPTSTTPTPSKAPSTTTGSSNSPPSTESTAKSGGGSRSDPVSKGTNATNSTPVVKSNTTTTTSPKTGSSSLEPETSNSTNPVDVTTTPWFHQQSSNTTTLEPTTKKTDRTMGYVVPIIIAAALVITVILFFIQKRRTRNRKDDDTSTEEEDEESVRTNYEQSTRERSSMLAEEKNHGVGSLTLTMAGRSSQSKLRNSQSQMIVPAIGRSKSLHSATQPRMSASRNSLSMSKLSPIWKDPEILKVRLEYNLIEFEDVISRGGFGEVIKGTYAGQDVALKRLHPENRRNVLCLDEFLHEVKLLSSLHHERIVGFVGVAWDAPQDVCLLLEYMPRGDLRNVLTEWKTEGHKIGWDRRKLNIALQVAEGLSYIHSVEPKPIVHRDLKSKNVLISDGWDAKLSDFGISRVQAGSQSTMTGNVGSSLWIAPEVILGCNYDEKADIYSFGIVLTELDSHELPYYNVTTPDGRPVPEGAILHMMTMGKIQAEFSPMSRTDMVMLGRRCLNLDPTKRPTAAELCSKLQQVLKRVK